MICDGWCLDSSAQYICGSKHACLLGCPSAGALRRPPEVWGGGANAPGSSSAWSHADGQHRNQHAFAGRADVSCCVSEVMSGRHCDTVWLNMTRRRHTSDSLVSDACSAARSAVSVCRCGPVDSRLIELCNRLNMLVVRLTGSKDGPAAGVAGY